ncbi:MAG: hypothetical protein ACM3N9_06820 [Syntrophothermus sp.]
MQKIKNILLLITATLLLFSCMKKENYPIEPQIEDNGFALVYDTGQYPVNGIISLRFTDGDGDIGLAENDTFPPHDPGSPLYYNLIINYFEKQHGQFVLVETTPPFSARIPVLNSDEPGKAIKGIITDTVPLNPLPIYDTIKFETFIYDRQNHKSNTVTTPEIILRRR